MTQLDQKPVGDSIPPVSRETETPIVTEPPTVNEADLAAYGADKIKVLE